MTPIEIWALGYALARGFPTPARTATGWWMPVGLPGQAGRHVILDPSPETIRAVTEATARPDVFIEVCSPREAVQPHVPAGWRFRDRAWLMAGGLTASSPPTPETYVIDVRIEGGVASAAARAMDGALAASGVCAVIGTSAVFDQIVTDEAHRRRGLGAAIMGALGEAARGQGATDGVLIATAEGRALYGRLGWRELSEVTSAISGGLEVGHLVRPARRDELAAVLALYRQLNPADPVLELAAAEPAWAALMDSAATTVFVAEKDGTLVASCTLAITPNLSRGARPYGVIENVVTDAAHRRLGLGRAVLGAALDKAWAADCYKVHLATGSQREATLRFYESAGFLRNGKTYFEIRRA